MLGDSLCVIGVEETQQMNPDVLDVVVAEKSFDVLREWFKGSISIPFKSHKPSPAAAYSSMTETLF